MWTHVKHLNAILRKSGNLISTVNFVTCLKNSHSMKFFVFVSKKKQYSLLANFFYFSFHNAMSTKIWKMQLRENKKFNQSNISYFHNFYIFLPTSDLNLRGWKWRLPHFNYLSKYTLYSKFIHAITYLQSKFFSPYWMYRHNLR